MAATAPAVSKRWRKAREQWIIGAAAVILFLLFWELGARTGLFDARYTSSPSRALSAGWTLMTSGSFGSHVSASLTAFFVGFFLAVVVAVPLGLLMGWSSLLRHLLDPLVMGIYATPRLAVLPMLILWLGVGLESKIAVVFLGAVIPILVNTMAGVREADGSLVQAARSFCATRLDIFRHILFPGSLPAIMSGIRLGVGRAVLGVVVGEMYAATRGIGHLIITYGHAVRMDQVIFLVALVTTFGYVATSLVRSVEMRLHSWRPR